MIIQPQPVIRQFPQQFFTSHNFNQAPSNYKVVPVQQQQPAIIAQQPIDTSSCSYHFRQQTLRNWYPIPTLCSSFLLLACFGIFMVVLGAHMLRQSRELSDYSVRYDTNCPTLNVTCSVSITIPENMRGPVFVYYQLHNFYQNHRLYSRSKKLSQLYGKLYTVSQQDGECSPISINNDLWDGAMTTSITGAPLDPNGPVNPCGLVALTVFNDTFTLDGPGGNVPISSNDIAWKGDIEKIKITDPTVMWRNTTDERFMNWMRISSRNDFRKLWGRIDSDLPAGTYTFTILNNYDMSTVNGEKWLALANANNFGGKNQLLSILYLVVGGLFVLVAIVIGILMWVRWSAARAKGIL